MDKATLRQIGVVRSEIRNRKSMPPLGAPARIELFAEYSGGLHRLGKHSHLWVMAWLDGAEREILQVTPRGVSDTGPEGLHGVFAVRSPARPNPIGLTLTRVVRAEGRVIEVDRLDFFDGTPVIDLKPYFVSRDLVFSAINVQIGRPASPEALRESLLVQAVNFHGEACPDLHLGVDIMTHFRSEILDMREPEVLRVTAPLARPHLIDVLMGVARATPGRGTLRLEGTNVVRLESDDVAREYELCGEGFQMKS